MIKFTKLDAVLNYVSKAVKEQADNPQLLQWANQAWRRLHLPNYQIDLKVVMVEVKDHKAELPDDVRKLVGVWYTQLPVPEDSYDIVVEVDKEKKMVILQQQLLLSSPWFKSFNPLRYLGQNKSAIIDEGLYNDSCFSGFSVDPGLKCLTVDVDDTSLVLEYYCTLKDEDCNILVPDNVNLLEGLGAYASAMVYRDRRDRNMEGAANLYASYLQVSQTLLNRFRGQVHLMNFTPALHEAFRKSRFDVDAYWKEQRNYHFVRKTIP